MVISESVNACSLDDGGLPLRAAHRRSQEIGRWEPFLIVLDQGLPDAYTPELYEQKTAALFQHVYESYYGAWKSVYEMAA